ncbi:Transmembrane protein 116 [Anabarilius grahami]|uniref:Transmembrane protein 116 n=1 Tax=Anabarilius grahami TaxID=495550 RepID=A0A3N0YEY6_ANAGA|nr:Transmembrane protein 116 [Anabarilius grahami]
MRIVSNGVQPYIVQTGVDTDGETQEEVTTFRMKLDVSEWMHRVEERGRNVMTQPASCVYSIVRCIQMTMAVLSILGAGSIIAYAVYKRLVRKPEVLPLFLLSLTDLLLALSWMVGGLLFTQNCDAYDICYNLHIVEQTLYMASFFYTLHYVWVLYAGLSRKYYRRLNGLPAESVLISPYSLLPLMLTVPVFVAGNVFRCYTSFTQPYRCLLMHTGAVYLTSYVTTEVTACIVIQKYCMAIFLATFLLTFIGIMILMCKARSLYKRVVTSQGFFGDHHWATLRLLERRMLLYPSAFFFCWGPAILLATMMLVNPDVIEGGMGVVLYILQAFTSASQGLLNCLVYGWTQQHFRSLSSSTLRDANTQTPLLRSQKRNYAALRSAASLTNFV